MRIVKTQLFITMYEWHYCGIRHTFTPISTMGSWNCQLYKEMYIFSGMQTCWPWIIDLENAVPAELEGVVYQNAISLIVERIYTKNRTRHDRSMKLSEYDLYTSRMDFRCGTTMQYYYTSRYLTSFVFSHYKCHRAWQSSSLDKLIYIAQVAKRHFKQSDNTKDSSQ